MIFQIRKGRAISYLLLKIFELKSVLSTEAAKQIQPKCFE